MRGLSIATIVVAVALALGYGAFELNLWFKRRVYGVTAVEARLGALEAACRSYGILPRSTTP